MAQHKTGCLVCGKALEYYDAPMELACAVCGESFLADAACKDRHYVCDACHAKGGFDAITKTALETGSRDPIAISLAMMRQPYVNMHGPEHHYLVPAALLAAAKNAGAPMHLEQKLELALQRARKVPGGICGLWGCCGAAVGAGIFTSVMTGASPLAAEGYDLCNLATATCLESIGHTGGPRCCKRNSWLAITQGAGFARQHFGVEMALPPAVTCGFFALNAECKRDACPYFPR